jgi:hypothetical protein
MNKILIEFDYDDDVEFELIDERSLSISSGGNELVIHPPDGMTIQDLVDAIQQEIDNG